MLKYVYEENQSNSMVSFKKIITKSNIAYSTAAKRLDILEEKGGQRSDQPVPRARGRRAQGGGRLAVDDVSTKRDVLKPH
jgi:hypothetical protein